MGVQKIKQLANSLKINEKGTDNYATPRNIQIKWDKYDVEEALALKKSTDVHQHRRWCDARCGGGTRAGLVLQRK